MSMVTAIHTGGKRLWPHVYWGGGGGGGGGA